MKKIILTSLVATLALTACDKKQAEAPAETTTIEAAAPATEAANISENTADTQHNHDHAHDHDHSHEHDDHAEHDHNHDHAHDHGDHAHHHDGDKFQCGDKSINIAVHNHEGEIEAHLTADDITYDLNQNLNDKKRFTTNEGIEGDGKPMTLILDGNKAQVLGANNATLLDCTKS
ncbi:putative lipoprotein [Moraxella bovoculi 237]|uniref:Putative lipoprotein n=1 Tax=Moraxella bovoculi 237 TaxID=743974 RepID=A0A066UFZ5_9GAMM|nr:hypothetical protein [Moraxella bovoculi]KDN24792.1 putative lipoprotein [Moraxella bovoculi 237]